MKGLVLSGGKGTRLRPLTYTHAKQLLPIANKPVLFFAIESLVNAGVQELGIIVGDTHEEIRAAVGDGSRWGLRNRIRFIRQELPLGLAHALLTARDFLGMDRFVMTLGDNLIMEPLTPFVRKFMTADCPNHCLIFLKHVDDPSEFGVAELESVAALQSEGESAQLRVKRLVEKPRKLVSNLALVGAFCFDYHILEAAGSIKPSGRGEYEITDAIQWLIDNGYEVRPHLLHDYWIDTGKMEDVLTANRYVLSELGRDIHPTAVVSPDSIIQGDVIIQAGAQIQHSIICGPSIVGKRSHIQGAHVGPFTSLYHDVTVENSEIENSIILEHTSIVNVSSRIEASLIGCHANIQGGTTGTRVHSLVLGDHSKIVFDQAI